MGWHLLYERVRMAASALLLLLLRGGSDGHELRSRLVHRPSCAACVDSQRPSGMDNAQVGWAGFLGYSEYRKVRKNHQRIIGFSVIGEYCSK